MSEIKSNRVQIIELIKARPGIRTPEIADELGIGNPQAYITGEVDREEILVQKVQPEHGGNAVNTYLSPVFAYDKTTGAVLKMLHAALTNFPALDDLPEVALRAAAHFQLDQFLENDMPEWLKKLLISLGIDPDNQEAATVALKALKAAADSVASKDAEIVALRAKADAASAATGNPDPAKYVPIEAMTALQTEVAALTAKVTGREVDDVIDAAKKAGKLLEPQVQWARELGNKDIAALRAYVASAPAVAALSQMQTGGKAPNGAANEDGLSEADLAVCKTMGYSPEQFKKTVKASSDAA
ncbi:phage protease [Ralstonia mannitolilytica]|uniref:phage protease n=1 Tax=Ralstonia mannitolilytica TaxID=105219 RepID=UPI0028F538B4|nr:phage protease [Ralstonia mannitolilytica]CAJ0858400.1 hypothetical protein R76727_01253 [Ralstonia mannitolilytica]